MLSFEFFFNLLTMNFEPGAIQAIMKDELKTAPRLYHPMLCLLVGAMVMAVMIKAIR
jgi:hypothetical protein